MIKRFKQWLAPADQGSDLFKDPSNEALHRALAAVFFQLIIADGEESDLERIRFAQIFSQEFGLPHQRIRELYFAARDGGGDVEQHAQVLDKHLNPKRTVRMAFVSMLNSLMGLDGVMVSEVEVFNRVLAVILPDGPGAQ